MRDFDILYDRVLIGLACHQSAGNPCGSEACPYHKDPACGAHLARDALAVIRELYDRATPATPMVFGHTTKYCACSACEHPIDPGDRYCRHCGRGVAWNG